MSFEYSIRARRDALPTVDRCNELLRQRKYDVVADDFVWHEHSGFLPCRVVGQSSGFELYADPELTKARFLGLVKAKLTGHSVVAGRFASNFVELACGLPFLAAVMELSSGEPHEEFSGTLSNVWAQAREAYVAVAVQAARLGVREPLPWNVPELCDGETRESRLAAYEPDIDGPKFSTSDGGKTHSLLAAADQALQRELVKGND